MNDKPLIAEETLAGLETEANEILSGNTSFLHVYLDPKFCLEFVKQFRALKSFTPAERIASLLNEALKLDPTAIDNLFNQEKIQVNEALANHPTIEVDKLGEGVFLLSPLGVLQGLVEREKEVLVRKTEDGKTVEYLSMSKEDYDQICKSSTTILR